MCLLNQWTFVLACRRTGGGAHWQSLFDPVTGAHEGYSLTAHYITPDCAYCAQLELNGKVLGYMRHNNLPAVSFTFSPTSEQETPPEPSAPVPLAPAPPVPAPSYEKAFSHSAHAGDGVVHVHVVRMHGEAAAGVVMAEGNKG